MHAYILAKILCYNIPFFCLARCYRGDLQAFGMYKNTITSLDSVTVNPPHQEQTASDIYDTVTADNIFYDYIENQ